MRPVGSSLPGRDHRKLLMPHYPQNPKQIIHNGGRQTSDTKLNNYTTPMACFSTSIYLNKLLLLLHSPFDKSSQSSPCSPSPCSSSDSSSLHDGKILPKSLTLTPHNPLLPFHSARSGPYAVSPSPFFFISARGLTTGRCKIYGLIERPRRKRMGEGLKSGYKGVSRSFCLSPARPGRRSGGLFNFIDK